MNLLRRAAGSIRGKRTQRRVSRKDLDLWIEGPHANEGIQTAKAPGPSGAASSASTGATL